MPRTPHSYTPSAPYPYTYMRTYVHHEFGLTGGGEGGWGGGGPNTAPANSSGPKVTTKHKKVTRQKKVTTNPATVHGSSAAG